MVPSVPWIELLETRRFFMIEDLLEASMTTVLRRKGLLQLAELAPTMRQTVAADQRRFIRCITPERIRHHQRLVRPTSRVSTAPPGSPRMGTPRHIQADRVLTLLDDCRWCTSRSAPQGCPRPAPGGFPL